MSRCDAWGTRPHGIRPSRARFGYLGGVLDALGHPRPWSAGDFLHFRIFHFRLPDLGIDVVQLFFKNFNFFNRAQKRSKLSPNDIYIYLRLSPKYGAKVPSQKKVIGFQS